MKLNEANKTHVFIVGSKGIPAKYGGFETFVEQITFLRRSDQIKYHVSCMVQNEERYEHNDADCFGTPLRFSGPIGRIFAVVDALKKSLDYVRENSIDSFVVYVLGCRIGPFIRFFAPEIRKLGGKLLVNPDGLEWRRDKWNYLEKRYLKFCEKELVKSADCVVCDSKAIETYIRKEYPFCRGKTTFIAYGAYVDRSSLLDSDKSFVSWLTEKKLKPFGYYLVVGRFVPENNYETMIREFMSSDTKKDFALITGVNESFLSELESKTHFKNDKRIKFVGTVYDQELLKKIREQAYGYFHGHEVGGTNPSLLEALASTRLNLLLDVDFNREVAEESALYWTKEPGSLASLIHEADAMPESQICALDAASSERVAAAYSWRYITDTYESLFLGED